jgi:hypothetical protein
MSSKILSKGTKVRILENAKVSDKYKGKVGYIAGSKKSKSGYEYGLVGLSHIYSAVNPSLFDTIVDEKDIILAER